MGGSSCCNSSTCEAEAKGLSKRRPAWATMQDRVKTKGGDEYWKPGSPSLWASPHAAVHRERRSLFPMRPTAARFPGPLTSDSILLWNPYWPSGISPAEDSVLCCLPAALTAASCSQMCDLLPLANTSSLVSGQERGRTQSLPSEHLNSKGEALNQAKLTPYGYVTSTKQAPSAKTTRPKSSKISASLDACTSKHCPPGAGVDMACLELLASSKHQTGALWTGPQPLPGTS